jgi:hypothetical protein
MWSGGECHPDDLRTCALTGALVHFKYATTDTPVRLQPLSDLLYGLQRTADGSDLWEMIAPKASTQLGGRRCPLQAAQTSPNGRYLAICCKVRTFLGFKMYHVGLLYSLNDNEIPGYIVIARLASNGWVEAANRVRRPEGALAFPLELQLVNIQIVSIKSRE